MGFQDSMVNGLYKPTKSERADLGNVKGNFSPQADTWRGGFDEVETTGVDAGTEDVKENVGVASTIILSHHRKQETWY